jgi:hypothetical protein
MKTYFLTLCIFYTLYCSSIAKTQTIFNYSFEFGDPLPAAHSEFDNLDYWKGGHTPDWLFYSNQVPSTYFIKEDLNSDGNILPILGNNNTKGYAGLYECEMLKQRLFKKNLKKNKEYIIEFYIRTLPELHSTSKSTNFPSSWSSINGEGELFIYLTKGQYMYALPAPSCVKLDIGQRKTINLGTINNFNYPPGSWHKIRTSIFTADNDYDWLQIDMLQIGNETYYILIDDVYIYEMCDHGCINGCEITDGATEPIFKNLIYNVHPSSGTFLPLIIRNLTNITTINYEIFNYLGQTIHSDNVSCNNGFSGDVNIYLPLYLNLSMAWYRINFEIVNSCGSCFYNNEFYFFRNFGNESPINHHLCCNPESLVKPCCEEELSIYDEEFHCNSELLSYHAIQNLTLSNITVNQNANIEFLASNSVSMTSGIIYESSNVIINLAPCYSGRKTETPNYSFTDENYEGNLIDNSTEILIYPNPANTSVTIENKSNSMQTFEMYNISGKNVLNGKVLEANKFVLNLEHFPKGFYTVIFTNAVGQRHYKKLVVH